MFLFGRFAAFHLVDGLGCLVGVAMQTLDADIAAQNIATLTHQCKCHAKFTHCLNIYFEIVQH